MVDRKVAGGNKPNNKVNKKIAEVIKPSSILPPRAVLSSPGTYILSVFNPILFKLLYNQDMFYCCYMHAQSD